MFLLLGVRRRRLLLVVFGEGFVDGLFGDVDGLFGDADRLFGDVDRV